MPCKTTAKKICIWIKHGLKQEPQSEKTKTKQKTQRVKGNEINTDRAADGGGACIV